MDDKVNIATKTVVTSFNNTVQTNIINFLETKATSDIIDIIKDEYVNQLNSKCGSNSKIRSIDYEEEFVNRLKSWKFVKSIKGVTGSIKFSIPDIDSFDFSNGLEMVQVMLEGVVGKYIEFTESDYKTIIEHDPDKSKAMGNSIYLVKPKKWILGKMHHYHMTPSYFAYTNTSTIDLFSSSRTYLDANIKKWCNQIIHETANGLPKEIRVK